MVQPIRAGFWEPPQSCAHMKLQLSHVPAGHYNGHPGHRQPLTPRLESQKTRAGGKQQGEHKLNSKQPQVPLCRFCSPERKREEHLEATNKNKAPSLHPVLADAAPRSWKGNCSQTSRHATKNNKKTWIPISAGLLLVPASSTDFCIASASSWSAMSSGRTSSRPVPYASRAHSGSSPSGRNEVCEPVVPITSTFFLRSMEHCKRESTHQGPAESQTAPGEKGRHKVRQSVSNRTAHNR